MKKGLILSIGSVLLFLVLLVVFMGVGYSNREIELRNLASAQEEANQAIFDKVWKVIAQKAQVTESYKDTFIEAYQKIMAGRYGKMENPMMAWVHENTPTLDASVFKSLMDTIEGQRESFAQVQLKLRDIKREHDNLRKVFPSSLFVGGRPELIVTIVTSEKTQEVFKTKKEEDIKIFK